MSKQAVNDFRAAVERSRELQSQIRDEVARGPWDTVAFARRLGYEFTQEELNGAFTETKDKLTAFEVEILGRARGRLPDLEPRREVVGGAATSVQKTNGHC